MTFKRSLIAGIAVLSFTLSCAAVFAQEETDGNASGDDQATAQSQRSPEQNWLKVCDPLDDGRRACIISQRVFSNGNFLGSFVLRDNPAEESRLMAVAAVPIGVMLPFGMRWQIDNGKELHLPYVQCDPASCITQVVVNEAYVNSLKKGAHLKLTAKTRQNTDLVVDIDLAGFTSVYEGEDALTYDQYQKRSTGAAALEQLLQDKAEAIRRQKEDEDGSSADDSSSSSDSGSN